MNFWFIKFLFLFIYWNIICALIHWPIRTFYFIESYAFTCDTLFQLCRPKHHWMKKNDVILLLNKYYLEQIESSYFMHFCYPRKKMKAFSLHLHESRLKISYPCIQNTVIWKCLFQYVYWNSGITKRIHITADMKSYIPLETAAIFF